MLIHENCIHVRDFVDLRMSLDFKNDITIPTLLRPATAEKSALLDRFWTKLDDDCKSCVWVPNLPGLYAIALIHDAHAIDESTFIR